MRHHHIIIFELGIQNDFVVFEHMQDDDSILRLHSNVPNVQIG